MTRRNRSLSKSEERWNLQQCRTRLLLFDEKTDRDREHQLQDQVVRWKEEKRESNRWIEAIGGSISVSYGGQGFSRRIRIAVVWSCEASILQDIAINIDVYTTYISPVRTYDNVKGKKWQKKKKKEEKKFEKTLSLPSPPPRRCKFASNRIFLSLTSHNVIHCNKAKKNN